MLLINVRLLRFDSDTSLRKTEKRNLQYEPMLHCDKCDALSQQKKILGEREEEEE
jgi:hypothetical protein